MSQFRAFSRAEDAWEYEDKMDRVLDTIERCPVPTIAAITGACTGGGRRHRRLLRPAGSATLASSSASPSRARSATAFLSPRWRGSPG